MPVARPAVLSAQTVSGEDSDAESGARIKRKRKRITPAPKVRKRLRIPRFISDLTSGDNLLKILAVLSVFQVYLFAAGQVGMSLCLLTVVLLALRVDWRRSLPYKLFVCVIALFICQWISLFWAVDTAYAWPDLSNMFIYIVCLAAGVSFGRDNNRKVTGIIQVICYTGLVLAGLIIFMRLSEPFKVWFFNWDMSGIFVNPYRLNRFLHSGVYDTMGSTNNTLTPNKSGGFFLNANIAGAWCAVMAFLTLACFNGRKWLERALVTAVYVGGVIASGSKGTLAILLLAPLVMALLYFSKNLRRVKPGHLVLAVLAAAVLGLFFAFQGQILAFLAQYSDYVRESVQTSACRTELLQHAQAEFAEHPMQGHGYGGWYQSFGLSSGGDCLGGNVPPLNALVLLWSQNGLIAALLGLVTIAMSLYTFVRLTRGDYARFAFFGGCAYLCLLLQSFGEDVGLFEDPRISVPLALTLGMALTVHRVRIKRMSSRRQSGSEVGTDEDDSDDQSDADPNAEPI